MSPLSRCSIVCLALLAGCGGSPPPPSTSTPTPTPTVFDDLVDKKRSVPADVEKAQREHQDALKKADADANGPAGDDASR